MPILDNLIQAGANQVGRQVRKFFEKDQNRDPVNGGNRFVETAKDVIPQVANAVEKVATTVNPSLAVPIDLTKSTISGIKDAQGNNQQKSTLQSPETGERVAVVIGSPEEADYFRRGFKPEADFANQQQGGQGTQSIPQQFQGDQIITDYGDGGADFTFNDLSFGGNAPTVSKEAVASVFTENGDINVSALIEQSAKAGLSVEDFLSLAQGLTGSGSEDREAIRQNLGIPDLVQGVYNRPSLDAQAVFDEAFAKAGLQDVRQKIQDIDAEIAKQQQQLQEARDENLNNPFISASSRSARIRNAETLAQQSIGNLQNQRSSLSDLYNRGLDQVESTVTRSLESDERNRIRSADQLNYLLQEAERQSDNREKDNTQQLLRYVPEFLRQSIEAQQNQPLTAEEALKLEGLALGNEKTRAEIESKRNGGDLKPDQYKVATFAERVQQAEGIFTNLESQILGLGRAEFLAFRKLPDIAKPAFLKKYEQAESNFINAVLRRESGAAISDGEYESARKQYFPQPGDDADLLEQKRQNREVVMNGLIREAGGAFQGDDLDSAFSSIPGFQNDLSRSVNGSAIGEISEKFESGGNPGAIGHDSTGGWSYGTYQLAHNNAQRYLSQSQFGQFFEGLQFNSPAFRERWKQVASKYPEEFKQDQKAFMNLTHFQPQIEKIKKIGFDFSSVTPALLDVIWSTAVQHGPGTSIVVNAIKEVGKNASEEELINQIYKNRWAGGAQFRSSTPQVKKSVYNRFFGENGELAMAINKSRSFTRSA